MFSFHLFAFSLYVDVKSNLSQQNDSLHQTMHPKTILQHSPNHHLAPTTPTSRSHSISSASVSSASSHPHYSFSMHSTPSTTHSPSTHSNAATNHSMSQQSAKYDFGHSTGNPSIHSSQNSSASSLTGNTNYMHAAANNLQSQLSYGNVKTETNPSSNYDYMNNCLQNGYFNASYGTGIAASMAAVPDLASYHHIQAAKLMATS